MSRCAASESTVKSRQQRQIPLASCRELWIDGFNVLMTIEVALSQGVVLLARDGCYRDLASVHGTYRRVVETEPALTCLTHELRSVPRCRWLLDQPVSNSGKLATLIRAEAERCALDWSVELVPDPDQLLKQTSVPIASADSAVLDACGPWVNLARQVIDARVPTAWVVDLS